MPEPNSVFGLPMGDTQPEQDPFADEFQEGDQLETPQELGAEPAPTGEAPATPTEPVIEEPAAEVPPEEPPAETATEPPAEPAAEIAPEDWALPGQYRTVAELREGYQNMRTLTNRTAEQNRALAERSAQVEEALARVIPVLEQRVAPQGPSPEVQRIMQAAREAGVDEDTMRIAQALAETVAEQRVAGVRTQMEGQLAAWREQQEIASAYAEGNTGISEFLRAHDLQRGGAEDTAVAEVVGELDLELSRDALEIAFEASKDPELRRVLRGNPAFVDSEDGMDTARTIATLMRARKGQPQAGPAQRTAPVTPHVETGATGAPTEPAEGTPPDEWQQVLELAKADRGRSVFGI